MLLWLSIWTGSALITRTLTAWLLRGWAVRLVALGLAGGILHGLGLVQPALLLLAGAWIVTAAALGRPAAKATLGEPDDQDQADAEAAEESPAADPLADLDRQAVAEQLHAALGETGGVHLTTLGKALPGAPVPTRDVRALLARLDIRVRAGVRDAAGVGREGVHRTDVPPLLSPDTEATPGDVVAAGQGNNNNEPMEFEQDHRNPRRWLRKGVTTR